MSLHVVVSISSFVVICFMSSRRSLSSTCRLSVGLVMSNVILCHHMSFFRCVVVSLCHHLSFFGFLYAVLYAVYVVCCLCRYYMSLNVSFVSFVSFVSSSVVNCMSLFAIDTNET